MIILNKCFLDTNVLTDWVIINSEIQKKETTEEKINYLKTFRNIRGVALYSYLLLETLKSNKLIPNYRFFTSRVALAELISNIKERYIAEDLFRKLIPIKYLKTSKSYITDEISKRTYDDIGNFILSFIKSKKLHLCEKFQPIVISKLILRENIDTYDSLLMTQSIAEKCDFFITSDDRLKIAIENLKVVKSNEIYEKIKSLIETPVLF